MNEKKEYEAFIFVAWKLISSTVTIDFGRTSLLNTLLI